MQPAADKQTVRLTEWASSNVKRANSGGERHRRAWPALIRRDDRSRDKNDESRMRATRTYLASGLDLFFDLSCLNWRSIVSSWLNWPRRAASSSCWSSAYFLSRSRVILACTWVGRQHVGEAAARQAVGTHSARSGWCW
jgi:hypothetical protein